MSYQTQIQSEAVNNKNFRKVLFTGGKSQLVVMDIKPGEDIGEETHDHVEQILYVFQGEGKAMLDGKESAVRAGDILVVTPGTRHNIINSGDESLKIATVYCPPNHIDGRVHATKQDAEADMADEEFGHGVE